MADLATLADRLLEAQRKNHLGNIKGEEAEAVEEPRRATVAKNTRDREEEMLPLQ